MLHAPHRDPEGALAACDSGAHLDVGEVESGSFWVEFLRGLKRRGLSGVRLAITDQHEGLKQVVALRP